MGRFLIINLLILIVQLSVVRVGFKYTSNSNFNNEDSSSQTCCLTQNEQNNCNFSKKEKLHLLYQKPVFSDKNFRFLYSLKAEKFIAKQSGLSPPITYQKIG